MLHSKLNYGRFPSRSKDLPWHHIAPVSYYFLCICQHPLGKESSSAVKVHLRDEAIVAKGNEGRDYKHGLKGEERSQVGKRQLKELMPAGAQD